MSIENKTVDKSKCRVCGKLLYKNNPNQIIYYCTKECRKKRFSK
jgi:endogenous inhibitor of DNA gyrase (YacG/DUF329 family)